jgi:putative ABC transport system ATP-binding protein
MGEVSIHALKPTTITLPLGKTIVVVGPSGSGKSTLLNVIGGIESPTQGDIRLKKWNIAKLKEKQLTQFRREEIGFIFQSYNLVSALTVEENIELGREISKKPLKMEAILKDLEITDIRNKFPHQLSGGQQQRVAIARALIKNPKILLCDEPTGALDEETGKKVLVALQKIQKEYKTTLLIITHNNGITSMADQVVKMKSGEVYETYVNKKPIAASKVVWA